MCVDVGLVAVTATADGGILERLSPTVGRADDQTTTFLHLLISLFQQHLYTQTPWQPNFHYLNINKHTAGIMLSQITK